MAPPPKVNYPSWRERRLLPKWVRVVLGGGAGVMGWWVVTCWADLKLRVEKNDMCVLCIFIIWWVLFIGGHDVIIEWANYWAVSQLVSWYQWIAAEQGGKERHAIFKSFFHCWSKRLFTHTHHVCYFTVLYSIQSLRHDDVSLLRWYSSCGSLHL